MMEIVPASGECADEQRFAFAKAVLDGRYMSVAVMSHSLAAFGLVLLQKVAAVNPVTVDVERKVLKQVRREFHIAFARAEHVGQTVIRLHWSHAPLISE